MKKVRQWAYLVSYPHSCLPQTSNSKFSLKVHHSSHFNTYYSPKLCFFPGNVAYPKPSYRY